MTQRDRNLEDDSDIRPPTQPAGALDPPRRFPPTAVGADTPNEEPSDRSLARARVRSGRIRLFDVAGLIAAGVQHVVRRVGRVLAGR